MELQQNHRGLYFGLKTIFIPPPPSENDIFSPSRDTSFFDSYRGLFALILPYFAFLLPLFLPFSHFLSPFFLFLSSFFLFLLHFPPFFSFPFHIFSPKRHRLIFFPPPQGGAYCPIYRPLQNHWRVWFGLLLNYMQASTHLQFSNIR